MNDTELEAMLRKSAPNLTEPAGLLAHQERILREARASRGHRTRVWVTGLGISALLLGGGSAAMAGAGMETPWGWVADNVFSFSNDAEVCFAGIQVQSEGVDDDSDIVRDARRFVGTLDLETLDTTRAEAELLADNRNAVDLNGVSSPIKVSDATLKQQALSKTVSDLLWAHLEQAGYSTDHSPISVYTRSQGCNE